MQGLVLPTRVGPPLGETVALNCESVQSVGLVGWWPPSAAPGVGVLYDLATYSTPGVLTNAPTWRSAPEVGHALTYVAGSSTYVDLPIETRWQPGTGPWTVAAWCRTTSSGAARCVYGYRTGVTHLVQLVMLSGGAMQLSLRDSAGLLLGVNSGSVLVNDGAWHLCVGLRTSQTTTEIWVDGVQRGTGSDASLGTITPSDQHHIGRLTSGVQLWDGDIGEVRLYNRALSPAEVWQLYDPATRWQLYQAPRRLWAPSAAVVTTAHRRTLSPLGARMGSRQAS